MKFIRKNLINALFILILAASILMPNVKAFLLKSLIEIGFYTPKIIDQEAITMDLNGIRFSDAKGKFVDLGELKGKVVFLNFWATWCPPCRAELPSLNKLHNQFKADENIIFIFADADGDLLKSEKFMSDRNYEMPVYKIESNLPEQIFGTTLPTTVIFDQQGRLAFRHEGMADYSDANFVNFFNKLKQAK